MYKNIDIYNKNWIPKNGRPKCSNLRKNQEGEHFYPTGPRHCPGRSSLLLSSRSLVFAGHSKTIIFLDLSSQFGTIRCWPAGERKSALCRWKGLRNWRETDTFPVRWASLSNASCCAPWFLSSLLRYSSADLTASAMAWRTPQLPVDIFRIKHCYVNVEVEAGGDGKSQFWLYITVSRCKKDSNYKRIWKCFRPKAEENCNVFLKVVKTKNNDVNTKI